MQQEMEQELQQRLAQAQLQKMPVYGKGNSSFQAHIQKQMSQLGSDAIIFEEMDEVSVDDSQNQIEGSLDSSKDARM
jgi:hypothetical protein